MPGQTGPTSRPGKKASSQNARKHGVRARTVIVGDERQEDFDRLAAGWRAEYEVDGQAAESLIGRVILADWMLRRAEGAYLDVEAELWATHPLEWTAEQHAQLALFLRYKTTAERTFYRAFAALRGLRKDKLREELDWQRMRRKMDAYAAEAVEKAERNKKDTGDGAEVGEGRRETPLRRAARSVQGHRGLWVELKKDRVKAGDGERPEPARNARVPATGLLR